MNRFLKIAIKQAMSHDYDTHLEYHLCALLVSGGNVISTGYNKRGTNGFVEHYTDIVRGGNRKYCLSTHAEMDAIAQVRARTDLNGSKIYVVRLLIDGAKSKNKLGTARPCEICQNILFAYGIKKAFYTIDENTYGVMRIINDKKVMDELFLINCE